MANNITSPTTQTHTILLVDDDAETLDTWAKGLEECCNYTVLKADTVKSALDVCRDQKMDCVVLDLDMDDASGFEVLLALVPDRKHRQIAVVVLTRLSIRSFITWRLSTVPRHVWSNNALRLSYWTKP